MNEWPNNEWNEASKAMEDEFVNTFKQTKKFGFIVLSMVVLFWLVVMSAAVVGVIKLIQWAF